MSNTYLTFHTPGHTGQELFVPRHAVASVEIDKDWRGWFVRIRLLDGETVITNRFKNGTDALDAYGEVCSKLRSI